MPTKIRRILICSGDYSIFVPLGSGRIFSCFRVCSEVYTCSFPELVARVDREDTTFRVVNISLTAGDPISEYSTLNILIASRVSTISSILCHPRVSKAWPILSPRLIPVTILAAKFKIFWIRDRCFLFAPPHAERQ